MKKFHDLARCLYFWCINRFANRQIELLQRRDATLSPASESLMRHLLQKLHARKREDRSAASANVKRKLKNS